MDDRCRRLPRLLFTHSGERLPRDAATGAARRLGLPVGSIGPTRARCLGERRGLLQPP
jgi:hypothetical protein